MGIFIQGAGGGGKRGRSNARKPNIQKDSVASTSRFKGMYILSEGEVEGFDDIEQQTFLEGTPLADANGNPNFQGVSYAFVPGTNDQDYIQGFPDVSNEIGVNVELKHGTPWIKALNNTQLSAARVRLKFGRLAETNSETGDVTGTTVKYAIDLQTDNGAYTTIIDTQVSDKASAGYERTHRIDLPKARNGWQIRVRRLTPNSDSDLIQNDMFVDAVAEVIDAKLRYPNTAMFAIQYDAETFSSVAKIAWLLKGKRIKVPSNYDPVNRTYTGLWNGTYKIAYSNNPAWVYYDLLTQWRYGLGERIDASMIDKWSLYQLGQYCDEMVSDGMGGQEPRFTCNVYLQKQQDAFNVLSNIAGVFRAMSYWNGEQIVLDADIPQDPVYTFSRANVVDGVFKYTGSRARDRHTLVKVAWSNPANNFETEYLFVRDEKGMSKYGVKVLDMSAFACTSQAQAQRAGLWALKTEQLETRQVSFAVGLDGFIPQVGNIINISDELFAGRANGGRVSKVDGTKITLDRAVDTGDTLIINGKDGKSERRTITAIDDKVVTVNAPFDNAEPENIWAIESADLKLMRFRIMSITQNEDMTFSITALQHEPKKYEAIDYGTHVDTSGSNNGSLNKKVEAPKSVDLSARYRIEQAQNIATLVIEWSQVKDAVSYEVEWRRENDSWTKLPRIGGMSTEIDNVSGGKYQARVRAVNAFGNMSQPTESALTEIASKDKNPPKLLSFIVQGVLFGMHLSWRYDDKSQDGDYVEIEQADAPDVNVAPLAKVSYPTTNYEINGMEAWREVYYRIRLVDKLGNKGAWTEWTYGQVDATADKILNVLDGEIKESHLYKELGTKIEKISSLDASVSGLNNAFSGLDKKLEQAKSDAQKTAQQLASDVERVKKEADAELANQKQLVTKAQSDASKAIADVVTESSKRKQEISSMQTGLTQSINQVDTKAESAITKSEQALTKTGQNAALIASNATASTNADSALSKRIDKVVAVNSDNQTAITNEVKARTNADSALGQRVGKVESTANNNVSRIGVLETTTSNNKEAIANTRTDLTASFNSAIDDIEIGGRNLLHNSELNNDIFKWRVWGQNSHGSRKVIEINDLGAITRAFELTKTVDGYQFGYAQDAISVLPNTTYTISVYYKTSDIINVGLGKGGGGSEPWVINKRASAGSGQWERYVYTWTTTANTTNTNYYVGFNSGGTGTVQVAGFKLEKGNKATDWTPAPEDVDSAINANTALITAESKTRATALEATGKRIDAVVTSVGNANTAITNETNARSQADSSLGKRIDSINTEVGKHKSSITNLSQAISDANKSISTTATQLRSETQTAIDSLEIGGRNLLLDSNAFVDANTTKIINGVPYRLIGYEWGYRFNNVKLHGTYTASVMVHNPNDVNAIVRITSFSNSLVIGPGETKLVSWTETFDDFNNSIYFLSHSDNTPLHFSYAKLEKGNKATDWTPAPEDVDASIAQVATESNANINSLRETVTNADKALSSRIDSLDASYKQADSNLTSRIASEERARANGDNANARKITTLESNVNGIDSRVTKTQSKISTLEQTFTSNKQATAKQLNTLSSTVESNRVSAELAKASEDGGILHVTRPDGASLSLSGGLVGAIKIRLPQRGTNTMIKFKVEIYNYSTNQASTYEIAGYNYQNGRWLNCTATMIGASSVTHNVRFGNDGVKDCIWIGETNTRWSYPKVRVIDFIAGYSNYQANKWDKNWAISLVTAFDTVNTTIDTLNPAKDVDAVSADIKHEATTRANADKALSTRIDSLDASYKQADSNLTSRIASVNNTLTTKTQAQANQINQLDSKIKGIKTDLTSQITQVNNTLSNEQLTQATYIKLLSSSHSNLIRDNTAAIKTESETRASAISSIAKKTTTLEATAQEIIDDVEQQRRVLVQQQATTDGLSAQYAIKIDNGGNITGYGLASTYRVDNHPLSEFAVRADRFYVASTNYSQSKSRPFVVQTSPQTIDGTTIPAGVYIDTAFIKNASVDTLKIRGQAVSITTSVYTPWPASNRSDTIYLNPDGGSVQLRVALMGLNWSGSVAVNIYKNGALIAPYQGAGSRAHYSFSEVFEFVVSGGYGTDSYYAQVTGNVWSLAAITLTAVCLKR